MNLKFKVLVVCMFVWTHVLSIFNCVFNKILYTVLEKCPDVVIPDMSKKKHPFEIVMACIEGNEEITKKAILFASQKWDKSFCSKGGVDFHELGKVLNASFIWVAYILKNGPDPDDEITNKAKKIYSLSVDLKRNIVKKYEVGRDTPSTRIDKQDILFHQCPLP